MTSPSLHQQQTQQPSQQATPQTTTQAPAPAAQQQPSASSSPSELPRTGFDVIPVALVGVALVLAGLALRRRAAHGRD